MAARLPALGALLLAGAGCAHYEPEPLDPVAEHDAIAARGQIAVDATAPSTFLSADRFPLAVHVDLGDGLTLAEANALALFHAPPLVAARRQARLRGAELLRAGLLENPKLFLGPRIATNGGDLIFPASLAFEIPLGGRLEAEESRAGAELDAARSRLLDSEAAALVGVRGRFIAVAALERRRAILQAVLNTSEDALATTGELVRAGEEDRVALGLATLDRDEAISELRTADVEVAEARAELLAGIGLLPNPRIELIAGVGLLDPVALPATDGRQVLRHSRLKALEAEYRATEHGLEIEVARQYPSLHLGPDFESDAGEASLGVGLSVTLPFLDTNAGGIAVAREQRAAGREAWQAELLDLARREARARARHGQAQALLADMRAKTLPAADAAEQALEAQRRGGQSSLIETLAARNAIARARLREVELMEEAAAQGLQALWFSGGLFPAYDTKETGAQE